MVSAAVLLSLLLSSVAHAAVSYTYDQLGRVVTAFYSNGLCIVYTYDANGNRTAIANVTSSSPVWGTGVSGCFPWTP